MSIEQHVHINLDLGDAVVAGGQALYEAQVRPYVEDSPTWDEIPTDHKHTYCERALPIIEAAGSQLIGGIIRGLAGWLTELGDMTAAEAAQLLRLEEVA